MLWSFCSSSCIVTIFQRYKDCIFSKYSSEFHKHSIPTYSISLGCSPSCCRNNFFNFNGHRLAYDFWFTYLKCHKRKIKKHQTSNNGFWIISCSLLAWSLHSRYSFLDSSFSGCDCWCLGIRYTSRLSLDSFLFANFC